MKKILILLLISFTGFNTTSLQAKKNSKPKDKIVLEIIHDGEIAKQISLAQEKVAIDGVSKDRFLLGTAMMLGNLAYSMIVGSVVDTGQGLLKDAIKKANAKYQSEWTASISKDFFYSDISLRGALDPSNMHFSGMKTIRLAPNKNDYSLMDTAFYFSAQVSNIDEIVKTSKFTMTLDTLLIDLSQTRALLPKGKEFSLSVQIKILSSWVNEATQYFKDQEMGSFTIELKNIIYDPKNPRCLITGKTGHLMGSCFVIPRSAYGIIMANNEYQTCFGQGEYSMIITIKETTNNKNILRDFFNDYVIKVTDTYGKSIKDSKIIETGIDINIPGISKPASATKK